MKQEIKFKDYKNCLENDKTILKSQRRFRIEAHNTFTGKVNKLDSVKLLQENTNALWSDIYLVTHWKNMQNRIVDTPKIKKLDIMINTDEVTEENT